MGGAHKAAILAALLIVSLLALSLFYLQPKSNGGSLLSNNLLNSSPPSDGAGATGGTSAGDAPLDGASGEAALQNATENANETLQNETNVTALTPQELFYSLNLSLSAVQLPGTPSISLPDLSSIRNRYLNVSTTPLATRPGAVQTFPQQAGIASWYSNLSASN